MKLLWYLADVRSLTKRCLLYTLRNVDALLTVLFLPIAMLLLFVYVFGGAIQTGSERYIDYVVFGVMLINIGYGAGSAAVSINVDVQSGIVSRFKTMPIGRSAFLFGHVLSSLIKNAVSTAIMLGVALWMGFRPVAGSAGWLAAAGVLALYGLAMTWLSILFGLLAKTPEGAGAFSYVFLFLPYASSAFVPPETMPGALGLFAQHQPITPINESVRAFLMNLPAENNPMLAVVWCGAIIAFASGISVHCYKRMR